MTNNQRKSGFSIVEIMVAMVIAAVLLGIAIPAFNGLIEQRTMTAQVNNFVLAVHYARSEAVKLGGTATVQAIDSTDGDNEWGPGFCVVVGTPGNCDDALRVFSSVDRTTLDATDDLADRDTISFNSRGLSTLNGAGTIRLCSTDAEIDPGRVIEINDIGRTSTRELVCYP